jgi:hypothetical protein
MLDQGARANTRLGRRVDKADRTEGQQADPADRVSNKHVRSEINPHLSTPAAVQQWEYADFLSKFRHTVSGDEASMRWVA